jgi:hypothetical protein
VTPNPYKQKDEHMIKKKNALKGGHFFNLMRNFLSAPLLQAQNMPG